MTHQFFLGCASAASNLRIHPSSLELSVGGGRGRFALWTAEEVAGSSGVYVLSNEKTGRILGVRRDGTPVVLEKDDAEGVTVEFEGADEAATDGGAVMVRVVDAHTRVPLKFKEDVVFKLDVSTTAPIIRRATTEAPQQVVSAEPAVVEKEAPQVVPCASEAPAVAAEPKALPEVFECPAGHQLVATDPVGAPPRYWSFRCDVCHKPHKAREVVSQRCAQCDFDVCPKCADRLRNGTSMADLRQEMESQRAAPRFRDGDCSGLPRFPGRFHHPHGMPFRRCPMRPPVIDNVPAAPSADAAVEAAHADEKGASEPQATGATLKCAKEHALAIMRGPLPTRFSWSYTMYLCDGCGAHRSANDEDVAHCQECSFDLCPKCQAGVLSGEMKCPVQFDRPIAPPAAAPLLSKVPAAAARVIVTAGPSRVTVHPNGDVTVSALSEEEAKREVSQDGVSLSGGAAPRAPAPVPLVARPLPPNWPRWHRHMRRDFL